MANMIDSGFFARLDAMAVQLKRHSLGKYQGEQRTVYAGDGLTFKDFAPYTIGDDFRRIDWRVYARTKELFVRRYEEDRNLTLHILLDTSGSMDYGRKTDRSDSKLAFAAMMALGVAYIAQKHNERIEFTTFGKDMKTLINQNQQSRVQSLVSQINEMRARGETDFERTMERYKERVKTKSLFFIFSDFLYPVETLAQLLGRYRKSQLFLIQVLHEDEVLLPFQGDMKFVDPEQEKTTIKAHVSKRTRQIYNDALRDHSNRIKDACKGFDAQFLQLDTRLSPVEGFVRLWNLL